MPFGTATSGVSVPVISEGSLNLSMGPQQSEHYMTCDELWWLLIIETICLKQICAVFLPCLYVYSAVNYSSFFG